MRELKLKVKLLLGAFCLFQLACGAAMAEDSPPAPASPGHPTPPLNAPPSPPPVAPVPPLSAALPVAQKPVPAQRGSVVRVNSTNQAYDFFRPWSKKAPVSRRGLGVVIGDRQVLVAAELVANSNYIEIEKPQTGEKSTAEIDAVDYEANVAELRPTDSSFLQGFQPLEVDSGVVTGDRLEVLQLEANGTPVSTQALLTTVEVGRYELDNSAFLLFRMSCPLQYRENSFTLPIVKGNRLAGILMRYDTRSQIIDAISAPVIQHFLKEAARKPYAGFPQAGFSFSPAHDPQLRRYLKLPEGEEGVYVDEVQPRGPAFRAGLRPGDVLSTIEGRPVDDDGNFADPALGKLSISYLMTTVFYSGQKITFTIARNGERQNLQVELAARAPEDYVIAPYVIDRAPRFFVLGGMVFQELSRQYLHEWGANWVKEAPQQFVYFDRFQDELFRDKRKIVFLSQVMPTDDTVGYEQLNYLIVTKLNGQEIKDLDDFAHAVQNPVNGFHKMEFSEDPHEIFLDAKQVQKDAPALQKLYALPELSR